MRSLINHSIDGFLPWTLKGTFMLQPMVQTKCLPRKVSTYVRMFGDPNGPFAGVAEGVYIWGVGGGQKYNYFIHIHCLTLMSTLNGCFQGYYCLDN